MRDAGLGSRLTVRFPQESFGHLAHRFELRPDLAPCPEAVIGRVPLRRAFNTSGKFACASKCSARLFRSLSSTMKQGVSIGCLQLQTPRCWFGAQPICEAERFF